MKFPVAFFFFLFLFLFFCERARGESERLNVTSQSMTIHEFDDDGGD